MLLIFILRSIFRTVFFLFDILFISINCLINSNFILKKFSGELDDRFDWLPLWRIFRWFTYGIILRIMRINMMMQRSVAVKERAFPFVLWQRSSLAPFRTHNRSVSSHNHHRTYVVTRRIFARSPLRCFHRKVRVIAWRGRYKGSQRVTHVDGTKAGADIDFSLCITRRDTA